MIIVLTSRETLVRRPEFCLVINKLRKSCRGFKADGLAREYPGICERWGALDHHFGHNKEFVFLKLTKLINYSFSTIFEWMR